MPKKNNHNSENCNHWNLQKHHLNTIKTRLPVAVTASRDHHAPLQRELATSRVAAAATAGQARETPRASYTTRRVHRRQRRLSSRDPVTRSVTTKPKHHIALQPPHINTVADGLSRSVHHTPDNVCNVPHRRAIEQNSITFYATRIPDAWHATIGAIKYCS